MQLNIKQNLHFTGWSFSPTNIILSLALSVVSFAYPVLMTMASSKPSSDI